ncbi:hypothetical protein FOA52_000719 [Chlamydomonas sp. UWO 241]|nr:hypothetical protein FOA52_000719 [Chlamydomonas sp. UWO 241]
MERGKPGEKASADADMSPEVDAGMEAAYAAAAAAAAAFGDVPAGGRGTPAGGSGRAKGGGADGGGDGGDDADGHPVVGKTMREAVHSAPVGPLMRRRGSGAPPPTRPTPGSQPIDRMPGCPKCRFSKTGCGSCIAGPMVTRPRARQEPDKAHVQPELPTAPTVYPTHAEFKDPFAYIRSLRILGEQSGIVCIVPPDGWDPPFALRPPAQPGATAVGAAAPPQAGSGGSGADMPAAAEPAAPAPSTGWKYDGVKFQVRRQFTSHLCMRAPGPAFLEALAKKQQEQQQEQQGQGQGGNVDHPANSEGGANAGAGGSAVDVDAGRGAGVKAEVEAQARAEEGCGSASAAAPADVPAADPATAAADRGGAPSTAKRARSAVDYREGSAGEEATESEGDADAGGGRGRRRMRLRRAQAAAAGSGGGGCGGKSSSSSEEGEFGHGMMDKVHTLRSYMAYAEWSKALHFGLHGRGGKVDRGSWLLPDWVGHKRRPEIMTAKGPRGGGAGRAFRPTARAAARGRGARGGGAPNGSSAAPEDYASAGAPASSSSAHAPAHPAGVRHGISGVPTSRFPDEPGIEALEGEFWRLVEEPGGLVEVLYGSDLDSGRHGSGFPLPAWRSTPEQQLQRAARQRAPAPGSAAAAAATAAAVAAATAAAASVTAPTTASAGRGAASGCGSAAPAAAAAVDASTEEYRTHAWNINCMTRSKDSVLRYVRCKELVTGVMMPWLYVGSCMSAFCWHVEDHSLYSVNYLHMGAPKIWYGVPSAAAAAFEDAMRDALPHLFEEDPMLLHRLVTMLSPSELVVRGVPVSRLVHRAGSFVVTFPNAFHGGFNAGFNTAEAVNFAPADWVTHGSDVLQKYRDQGKSLTISHDALLVTLVEAAPLVAAKAAAAATTASQQQQQSAAAPPQQQQEASAADAGAVPDPVAGPNPDGEGGWMRRWDDGVTMADVPLEALLLAAGELTLRIEVEEARRERARAAGVMQETRMSGSEDGNAAIDAATGVHTDTADSDCAVCACDLHLSAVVSRACPGCCVCCDHAAELGAPPGEATVLVRHSLPELRSLLSIASSHFPDGVAVAAAAARVRRAKPPGFTATRLGPLVELGDLPGMAKEATERAAARAGKKAAKGAAGGADGGGGGGGASRVAPSRMMGGGRMGGGGAGGGSPPFGRMGGGGRMGACPAPAPAAQPGVAAAGPSTLPANKSPQVAGVSEDSSATETTAHAPTGATVIGGAP